MPDNTPTTAKEALNEFISTFGLQDKSAEFWETLIKEECAELEEAFANLMKELADVTYVLTGYSLMLEEDGVLPPDRCDTMDKLLVERAPSAFLFDLENEEILEAALKAVHESNMSKILPDGTVLRREVDGKVLKGPNYKPPNMQEVIKKYHHET